MHELHIDGSHGEGGGQILRTALSLAAIAARPLRVTNIRAGRAKPGLAAQHVVAARAMAALCKARLTGDALGSQSLTFMPGGPVGAGDYFFDVAEARPGGSAGSTTLILQTVLLALALCGGRSTVTIRGGTHMAWAPPYDYIRDVWAPALSRTGIDATVELRAWGWYPAGGGEIQATVAGLGPRFEGRIRPIGIIDRGALGAVAGRAVTARLPSHIAQRMADRARAALEGLGVPIRIEPQTVSASCPGAGLFLVARYEHIACGFSALGERGKSSEAVADEAVARLLGHHRSGAALDSHLADQILAPLSFAAGRSHFSTERITPHLETNAWVIEQFRLAGVTIEPASDGVGLVTVLP
jgi:RNA 3'-terminal phosphate cyclase (ATP)